MDTKKFIQLVEEKKKRVLEKKEAPLKWEQKLEAAAKAKADAEAKVKKRKKRWKMSDTENSDDGSRKSSKKRCKKQGKHDHSESSSDKVKVEKKHRYRSRRRRLNNDNSDDDLERGWKKHSSKHRYKSSSDFEGSRAPPPRKGRRSNQHCKHHSHQMSSSDYSSLNSSDERKIDDGRSKHSPRSSSDDLVSDFNDHLKNRNQSGSKLSDDHHHHDYSDERKIHGRK